MAGETPGGGAVHVGGGEGVEAQLCGAGVDILGNGLQTVKVLDLVHAVTGLLDEVGVDDDAVALVAVADGDQTAVRVIEVVGVGAQLLGDGGAGQIHGKLAPLLDAGLVADDEEGGRGALVHLGGERLAVAAGGGGDDLHGDTGLLGILGGQRLGGLIQLRLEVQPVNGTLIRSKSGGACQRKDQDQRQHKRDCLFHVCSYSFFFIFGPNGSEILLSALDRFQTFRTDAPSRSTASSRI